MNLTTRPKISRHFKNKRKENIIAALCLIIAAVVLEAYAVGAIFASDAQAQKIAIFWGPYEIFNQRTSDVIAATVLSLPSIGLILTGYLLFESHSMGWKISLGIVGVIAALFAANTLRWDQAALTGSLISAGAIMELWSNRKTSLTNRNSPIMTENLAKFGLRLSGLICIGILVGMVAYIAVRGAEYVNLDFITGKWEPMNAILVLGGEKAGPMGGISDMIVGSLLLILICEAVAIPLGLGSAIYLAEYSTQNKLTDTVRFFIEILAGAPSVVIGLVGAAFFVQQLNWGQSLLSGGLSLAMMTIPWNIRVAEEAIRAVPNSFREASYALGATQSQTIAKIVLLAASPGIITGIILGTGAAIGETAVVIFTAGNGVYRLPEHMSLIGNGQAIPSLPVWIYNAPGDVRSARVGEGMTYAYNLGYAGALVLVMIFLAICVTGLIVRNYMNKKITGK